VKECLQIAKDSLRSAKEHRHRMKVFCSHYERFHRTTIAFRSHFDSIGSTSRIPLSSPPPSTRAIPHVQGGGQGDAEPRHLLLRSPTLANVPVRCIDTTASGPGQHPPGAHQETHLRQPDNGVGDVPLEVPPHTSQSINSPPTHNIQRRILGTELLAPTHPLTYPQRRLRRCLRQLRQVLVCVSPLPVSTHH
jgi:hypothetical protein